MKKFDIFSILRPGKLFLLTLAAWFTITPLWAQDYFCLTMNGGATPWAKAGLVLLQEGNPDPIYLEYSTDKENWTELKEGDADYPFASFSNMTTATGPIKDGKGVGVARGKSVYIRAKGKNERFGKDAKNYWYFKVKRHSLESGTADLSGNIMSLLDPNCFRTDVPDYCFYNLFNGSSFLYAAPELPATELGEHCYDGMFRGCYNLNSAPVLPATDLANGCYANMFYGCSSINYLNVGFTSWGTNDNQYTLNWVNGVANSGTFVCKEDLDQTKIGNNGIPSGWRDQPTVDETNYLCFTTTSTSATIKIEKQGNPTGLDGNLQYSHDGSSWTNYTIGNSISLNRKTNTYRVYFRSKIKDDSGTCSNNAANYYKFTISGYVEASGNIMSLLKYDCSRTDVPNVAFYRLFNGCTTLKSLPELPATELGTACYQDMFASCTSLYTSSQLNLPAENLSSSCYYEMFANCTSLTDAPELPAMNLANDCYHGMFLNCTSLLSAPNLPATTLKSRCYHSMFKGCSSLNYIHVSFSSWNNPSDATTDWASDNDARKFPEKGIFVCPTDLPRTFGTSFIPKDATDPNKQWSVNTKNTYLCFSANQNASKIRLNKEGSPNSVELEYCTSDETDDSNNWTNYTWSNDGKGYLIELNKAGVRRVYIRAKDRNQQFSKDASNYYRFEITSGYFDADGDVMSLLSKESNLSKVPDWAFYRLFNQCSRLKSVPILSATELGDACYQFMFASCQNIQSAPLLPANSVAKYCYYGMFANCYNLKKAPQLDATNLAIECYSEMFKNCQNLTEAPSLPASKLELRCYYNMFEGCSRLKSINVAFTSWGTPLTNGKWPYTNEWVKGVSSEGYFFGPNELEKTYDEHHIPVGWNSNLNPLCFTAIEDGTTLQLKKEGNPNMILLQYSKNYGSTWVDYDENQFKLNTGQKVFFRAKDNNSNFSKDASNYYYFETNKPIKVNGNLAFLMTKETGNCSVSIPDYCFYKLFCGAKITSAPEVSTSNQVGAHSYEMMFKDCKDLVSGPRELPATSLAESCYEGMFEGCESITTAPTLPINQGRAVACYKAMFKNCKSLTSNIPSELGPGWNLQPYCFESMFEGCESLTTTPTLPTSSTQLTEGCYKAMFKGCTSLVSSALPTLPANVMKVSCYESMFEGCTGLTTPATQYEVPDPWNAYTLAEACFKKMYKGCTSLTSTPNTFNNALYASCFEGMFEGCTSLTKVPSLSQESLAARCYYRMFAGCTSLKQAPELPAKKENLKDSCYAYMFNGCTNLHYMDVAFNEWHYEDLGATHKWVENVSPTGTFMCPDGLAKVYDNNHIPVGWSAEDNGDYLYFTKLSNEWTDLRFTKEGSPNQLSYKYSTDKKNWTSVSGGTYTQLMGNATAGTTVYIKITEGRLSKDANNYWKFTCDKPVAVSGNITSLLDASMEQTDVPDYSFYKLFAGCTSIQDISGLKMPATEVGAYAYANMFEGCTYLQNNSTVAPELPATTLGNYCYQNLFKGWKKLQVAPALPAKTLAEGCYSNMFKGCTSLATAPVLPATTLVNDCYDSMFDGCSSLNSLNVSFTAWLDGATDNWVNDVADSGDLTCPWSLAQSAKDKWVTSNNYDNAYGGSKIPKDKDNKWIILTHTDMEFNYRTGELSIVGGNPIYWSTDENLAFDNYSTVGTRVDAQPAIVDCNEWLNATTTRLDSITYYALALTGDESGFTKPTVNSLTIYRHPKKIDMCICDTEEEFETAMYYASKVSSADYPVKVLIEDGEYNFGNKSFEVGEYVSVIGESLNGTILKSSAEKGVLYIKGNDAYLQDMKLVNTGSCAAFTNKGQRTTLHVAMEGYYNEGGMSKHYLPEAWDRATDPTQATITAASVNGSSISLTSNAKYFLVRVDEKYAFANSTEFHLVESIAGKNVTVRAANNRGAFGEPITPTLITADGLTEYNKVTVKLNGYGFSSFCFDDANVDQLQVIGASVYKGIYREGAVYLVRLNEHDIVPKRTGVILAGLQNSTVSFYENNSVLLSDEESNPYNYLPDEKCIGMSGNWSTETIVNNGHNYYVLSGTYGGFKPLKKDGGTIKPNKAYFDLGNETNASSIRIIFGMWEEEEEEVVSGINYLPTAGNDSEYSYMLTGVRMKDAKGLVIQNNKVVLIK
jgi:hypothetical protein